jgi:hypothetical protein
MPPEVNAGPDAVEPRIGSAPGGRLTGRSLDNCVRRRSSSGCDEQRTPKPAGKGTRSPGQDRGWAKHNKLTISGEKSVFMINKSPPRAHHRDIKLRVEGAQIKKVDGHTYLGVMVDPKLNFQANAAYTLKKARRTTMGLRRIVWKNWGQETALALRAIYRGAILPILAGMDRPTSHHQSVPEIPGGVRPSRPARHSELRLSVNRGSWGSRRIVACRPGVGKAELHTRVAQRKRGSLP